MHKRVRLCVKEEGRKVGSYRSYPVTTPVDCLERGHSVVAGAEDNREYDNAARPEGRAGEAEYKNVGSEFPERQQRTVSGAAEGDESRNGLDSERRETECGEAGTGVEQGDRAGNTIAERVRAATAGLLAKAGRVGERLRGMAEYVRAYATGERGTERTHHELEQAGTAFERAAKPVVERLNIIEQRQLHERELQHQKTLELERSPRQKTYHGPTLG